MGLHPITFEFLTPLDGVFFLFQWNLKDNSKEKDDLSNNDIRLSTKRFCQIDMIYNITM